MTNPRTAIYPRVSTAKQVEHGHSLAEQEARCRAFVTAQGWTLDERHVYVEPGVSGAKSSRPALDRMLAAAEAGDFDVIVGPDVDRIGRSASHTLDLFERLDKAGVKLYDSTGKCFSADDPGSSFTRNVLAAAAQYERDMIAERSRRSAVGKKARGSYNGGPRPFGYIFSPNGGLVVDEAEAAIVRRIFAEYVAGKSLRGIGGDLNTDKIKAPRGGVWTQGRIAERLDNPVYIGEIGGKPGLHEAIIDTDTWDRTRALRSRPTPRRGGRKSNTHLLGNGLLICECGAPMYPRRDTRSARHTYRCRGRDERATQCDMPPLPATALDAAVREWISSYVFSEGLASDALSKAAKRASADASKTATAAARQVADAESKLRNGQVAMLSDAPPFDPSDWREIQADLKAEVATAKQREVDARKIADALKRPPAELRSAAAAVREAAKAEAADADTVAAQRAAIERIFARFDVLTGPVDAPDADTDAETAIGKAQTEALDDDLPRFQFKPQERPKLDVVLIPQPRPEIVAQVGGIPIDALPELGGGFDASGSLKTLGLLAI
jgi:site-specific DNA recombinase